LPLSAPMPYGVHARFWMQPDIVLAILSGVGAGGLIEGLFYFIIPLLKAVLPSSRAVPNNKGKQKGEASQSSSSSSADDEFYSALTFYVSTLIQGIFITFILKERFPLLNRSSSGWVMHTYGAYTLDSLPSGSLLVSHTDLDWNPVSL
jgi:hypothetical protein